MPILGMFIIVMLILVTTSLIMVILGLRYHGKTKGELPSWLQMLLFPPSCHSKKAKVAGVAASSSSLDKCNNTKEQPDEQFEHYQWQEQMKSVGSSVEVSTRLDRLSITGQAVVMLVLFLAVILCYVL